MTAMLMYQFIMADVLLYEFYYDRDVNVLVYNDICITV